MFQGAIESDNKRFNLDEQKKDTTHSCIKKKKNFHFILIAKTLHFYCYNVVVYDYFMYMSAPSPSFVLRLNV